MATPRLLRIFAKARKWPHKETALAVVIVRSCIALPVLSSVSFAQAQLASPAPQKQPVPVKSSPNIEDNGKSELFVTVVVPATIQAFFVTDLYAKDSGYISQIKNDIGDHVERGQVLAVIEDPELQAQFERAQAAVQQAKAALEVAKRQLAGIQADLNLQQVTLKRQKELFAGKAATAPGQSRRGERQSGDRESKD